MNKGIEDVLIVALIIVVVGFILYFIIQTIIKASKSAPQISLLYNLEDDDESTFHQILIDYRDSKLDYIFENFNIEKSKIENSKEYGLCLILNLDTGNDLWEVSIYSDIVEIYNLTNSTNQTIEIIYDKEETKLSKEEVYKNILSKIE